LKKSRLAQAFYACDLYGIHRGLPRKAEALRQPIRAELGSELVTQDTLLVVEDILDFPKVLATDKETCHQRGVIGKVQNDTRSQ
jgi:hypothetical protein